MTTRNDFLDLYRAILWRIWIEQRRSILLFPLLMTAVFVSVLLATQFVPGLLTGPTLHALQATSDLDAGGHAAGRGALPRAFIEHQAPYLLALFSGLSAASVTRRVIGSESERGSLEILLATRHEIAAIGTAILFAAYTMASISWIVLVGLSVGITALCDAWLHLQASSSLADLSATIAMQLVLTLLASELTMIVALLCPGFARTRGGVTADPTTLLASLPALGAFVAANLLPGISVLQLSLWALLPGAVLLCVGAGSLRLWFRPERFLET